LRILVGVSPLSVVASLNILHNCPFRCFRNRLKRLLACTQSYILLRLMPDQTSVRLETVSLAGWVHQE
jgi:hypothetical protein